MARYSVLDIFNSIFDSTLSALAAIFERKNATTTATIADGASLSGVIDVRRYAGFTVHMSAAWTAAKLAIVASPTSGGTYQVANEGGNVVDANAGSNVVAGKSYTIAPGAFPLRYIKFYSWDGTNAVAQGAERVLNVDLKA